MRDVGLPAGHRSFRALLLLVLVGLSVLIGCSDAFAGATSGVLHGGARFTAAVWRPLIHHGDGWIQPLLPGGRDDPPPAPSATPLPASPAPAK